MTAIKITKRTIDALETGPQPQFYYDTDLTGFGVKVNPTGKKTFFAEYRTAGGRRGKTRRYTIGVYGAPLTPEQARQEARRVLGMANSGQDPAKKKQDVRDDPTVAELCDLYLLEGVTTKKPSTIETDKGRIKRHIKPLLGQHRVKEVTRAHIERFLRDLADGKTQADVKTKLRGRAIVSGGKGTASRTVGLLGGIFTFAQNQNLVTENPVRGVKRYRDKRVERFLSGDELAELGRILNEATTNGANLSAIRILHILVLTGCRCGEIAGLKWSEVNLDNACLYLSDGKTGQRTVLLSEAVCSMLQSIIRVEGSNYVFPATVGNGHYTGTPKVWRRIRVGTKLADVRIHDLRHTFASVGVSAGISLPIVGNLIGHRDSSTTQRYAHLADDPVRQASNQIGAHINAAMKVVGNAA